MGLRPHLGLLSIFGMLAALSAGRASASPFTFSYGGRLADVNDQAVTGSVDIEVKFFGVAAGGSPIGVSPQVFTGVKLDDGTFQVDLNLLPAEMHLVFSGSGDTYVEVTDRTHGVTYPRQKMTAIPYALKVPVDGSTITYNNNGELTAHAPALADVAGLSAALGAKADTSHTHTLAGDVTGALGTTKVTQIQGKPVSAAAPGTNQVLQWTGSIWAPAAIGGAGTVTSVTAGAGLSGGTINGAGTISLPNVGSPNTYYKVTTDAQGRVVTGVAALAAADIPPLDAAKITTGLIPVANGGTGASTAALALATLGGVSITGQNGPLAIGTNDSNPLTLKTNGAPVITVLPGGNVGIGTTNPSAKLAISGTPGSDGIRFPDGTLQVTASVGISPFRFSRTAVNSSDPDGTKDNTCFADFGSPYTAALPIEVGMYLKPTGWPTGVSFNTSAYSSSFVISTDTMSTASPGLYPVACIRRGAPIIFSRTMTSSGSPDTSKDSICTSFGPSYQAATWQDVAAFATLKGVYAGTVFNVAASTQSYTLNGSGVVASTGVSEKVACMLK